jgi:hypothetical protein
MMPDASIYQSVNKPAKPYMATSKGKGYERSLTNETFMLALRVRDGIA